jgi:hypothetical protein
LICCCIHIPAWPFRVLCSLHLLTVRPSSACLHVLIKGKVVPVLLLSITPLRRVGDFRCCSTHSLSSALDGGEWLASRSGRFTPRERALGTHWIGGWVGPRAVLNAVVKRKIPSPRRESNSRTPTIQPVAQRYTD